MRLMANVQQVSYGRRNALTGVTGLVPTDEDTDARVAVDEDATIQTSDQIDELCGLHWSSS